MLTRKQSRDHLISREQIALVTDEGHVHKVAPRALEKSRPFDPEARDLGAARGARPRHLGSGIDHGDPGWWGKGGGGADKIGPDTLGVWYIDPH